MSTFIPLFIVLMFCIIRRSRRRRGLAPGTGPGAVFGAVIGCIALTMLITAVAIMFVRHRDRFTFAPAWEPPGIGNVSVETMRAPQLKSIATQPTTQSEKLWVSDWQGFLNSASPSSNYYYRAESSGYFATDDQALASAQAQAVAMLSQGMRDPNVPESLMRAALTSAIHSRNSFVSDVNFERVERPYGELWRCSLLLKISPDQTRQLMSSVAVNARLATKQKIAAWGSLGALMLVLFLMYLFLNAATKGYFVWKLRAAVVMILLVAVLVVSGILNSGLRI